METKLLKLILYKMTELSLKDSMKKYILKKGNLNENELKRLYSYPIYPIDFKTYSD